MLGGAFDPTKLEVDDYIDAQDTMGNWYIAKVVEKIGDDKLKLHFKG